MDEYQRFDEVLALRVELPRLEIEETKRRPGNDPGRGQKNVRIAETTR